MIAPAHTLWSKDNPPPKFGRPKGKKNRETIARRVLELNARKVITRDRWAEIIERYPTLDKAEIDLEEVMTTIQVGKAIYKEDSKAYELVMNMAYKPHEKQENTTQAYIFSSNLQSPYIPKPDTQVVDVEVHKPDTQAE